MSAPKPKSMYLAFDKITPDSHLNPARFVEGKVHGVSVKDNRDLAGMMRDLLERPAGEEPGVQRPISVLKKGDTYYLFAGFRRIGAVGEFVRIGQTKAVEMFKDVDDVATKVTTLFESFKKIPANVYESTGNDVEDMRFILSLGNDQDQKGYVASGLLNAVWALQAIGQNLRDISLSHGFQILNLTTKGRETAVKIRQETDLTKRAEMLKTALKGTLDDTWLLAGKLGEQVKKAFFIKMLRADGLTDERPEFDVTRERLNGKAKGENGLRKAKELDGVAWKPDTGGPIFNTLIQKFIDEEANPPVAETKYPKPKAEEIKAALDTTLKSDAARSVLQWAQGVPGSSKMAVDMADQEAYRFQLIKAAWLKRKAEVKNPAAMAVLNGIFVGDPLAFETVLAEFI